MPLPSKGSLRTRFPSVPSVSFVLSAFTLGHLELNLRVCLAFAGYVSLVELSTPLLRAKTAGIAAAIQSCSGILLVSTILPYS